MSVTREFLKGGEVVVINGRYVCKKGSTLPVYNSDFINAQLQAEYVVAFAEEVEGKDFVGKTPDNLEDVKKAVMLKLQKKSKEYVSVPKAPKMVTQDKLKSEALAFHDYNVKGAKAEKVNSFMEDRFRVLSDFEEFGLYFDNSEVSKLNKIYTMDEIIKAVEKVIDLI